MHFPSAAQLTLALTLLLLLLLPLVAAAAAFQLVPQSLPAICMPSATPTSQQACHLTSAGGTMQHLMPPTAVDVAAFYVN